jgi:orotidine-5'-phosphate decarboxylase
MTRQQLVSAIRSMGSYLCVGLDTDPDKIPRHLRDQFNRGGTGHGGGGLGGADRGVAHRGGADRGVADAIFEFNRNIIDATKEHCVAYKINTAFYEALGSKGWEAMERTVEYIPATHFKIADAKRGDIGNTSSRYARAFFETLAFDAVTVAPYMGWDSVRPFLEYKDKWTIVLGLTSNPGSEDFEMRRIEASEGVVAKGKVWAAARSMWSREEYLYERVLTTAMQWGTPDNLMFVIGATQVEAFERVRLIATGHFFLVPGVGAQGGSLEEISKRAMNADVGLLVNVSRGVIYASGGEDFAAAAGLAAAGYRREMQQYL